MPQVLTPFRLHPPSQVPVLTAPTGPETLSYAGRGRLIVPWRRPADFVRGWGRLTIAPAMLMMAVALVATVGRVIDECWGGLGALLTGGLSSVVIAPVWGYYSPSTPSPVLPVLRDSLRTLSPLIAAAALLVGLGVALIIAGRGARAGSRAACTFALSLILPWGLLHVLLMAASLAWMVIGAQEMFGFDFSITALVLGSLAVLTCAFLLLHWWRLVRGLLTLRRTLLTA